MKINLLLGIFYTIIFVFLQETVVAVKQADATPTSWVVKVFIIVHYVTCDYDLFFCRQVDCNATVSDFNEKVPNMAHTVKSIFSLSKFC